MQAGLFFLPGQVPPTSRPSSQDLGKRSEGRQASSRGGGQESQVGKKIMSAEVVGCGLPSRLREILLQLLSFPSLVFLTVQQIEQTPGTFQPREPQDGDFLSTRYTSPARSAGAARLAWGLPRPVNGNRLSPGSASSRFTCGQLNHSGAVRGRPMRPPGQAAACRGGLNHRRGRSRPRLCGRPVPALRFALRRHR